MQNRIKELRSVKNITQSKLAKIIGVAQNTLSYWENGTYDIDSESLKKIAVFFECTIDEVLGVKNANAKYNIKNISPFKTKKVPLLGDIACGEPIFTNEEHGEFVLTSEDISVDFCLRAKGDSMIGARILDGDIVFIKKQTSVDNGQIAAVLIGDEATLKRVYYYPDKNKLVLGAENPAYEPFVYVGEELEEVKILGRAVAFQSVVR